VIRDDEFGDIFICPNPISPKACGASFIGMAEPTVMGNWAFRARSDAVANCQPPQWRSPFSLYGGFSTNGETCDSSEIENYSWYN
jgi:hypothetical protein